MIFENNYGTAKVNNLETQQSPDIQFVAEQMEDVDKQQQLERESVEKMNGVLHNIEQLPNSDFVEKNANLLRNLGEKAKKGALIGAAALGITAAASSPAFGEQIAQNEVGGRLQVGKPITAQTYLPENANAADKRLNIDSTDFNNPNRIRLRPLNEIRLGGQQRNRAFQGQLNQYEQRQTLPGATVNGESVYEIAPGVYGNENSIYKKGDNGSEISVGTVTIE
ncbi:MAG: hypothetical protein U9Q12_03720 [Patescibacteria group bacterium]|nr:hypothetical protein [Patescibacteria group bacterium]